MEGCAGETESKRRKVEGGWSHPCFFYFLAEIPLIAVSYV